MSADSILLCPPNTCERGHAYNGESCPACPKEYASAIAIISPDGNRVIGFRSTLPLHELRRAIRNGESKDVERDPNVDTAGDWPLQFDQVYVAEGNQWRLYNSDDLPLKWW